MVHSAEVCLYRLMQRTRDEETDMNFMPRKILKSMLVPAAALALAWGLQQPAPAQAQGGDLVVFAAASLKNALDNIHAQWQRETGKSAKISYAASNTLAKQIEQGAPAQLFISADIPWMDYVDKKDLIKKETRSDLLGNRIV